MLRSMYSGISGLKSFQNKLDVIGNNIANVNTYGYKKSRVTFQDLVSQEMAGASSPSINKGGTNPKQVGLGTSIGSIDTVHTQGSLQTTGRPLDLAISGEGLFIVNQGSQNFYTRAGNFYIDQGGMLVNANGMRVMGYGIDNSGAIDTAGGLQQLHISDNVIHQPETDSMTMVGNLDASQFIKNGTIQNGGSVTVPFKIFDAKGVEHQANLTFDSPVISSTKNASGEKYVEKLNFTIDGGGSGTPQTGTVTFKPDGTIDSYQLDTDPATFTYNNQKVQITEQDLDFSGLTLSNSAGTADVIGDVAKLTGYQIGSSGEISAILSNGDVQMLGQIALAGFNNPGGLEKAGNNLYSPTNNSGNPEVEVPGDGLGSLRAGMLEMSNVDLATAFTEMIVAERGFQANTKIITTSDEILQDLVNLKR
ncbi:MAG TPA: flagellar hook protein FlgE [Bacillales bacterium]|nr:flagellar hook protein FlgE [Bacillales bacterium]